MRLIRATLRAVLLAAFVWVLAGASTSSAAVDSHYPTNGLVAAQSDPDNESAPQQVGDYSELALAIGAGGTFYFSWKVWKANTEAAKKKQQRDWASIAIALDRAITAELTGREDVESQPFEITHRRDRLRDLHNQLVLGRDALISLTSQGDEQTYQEVHRRVEQLIQEVDALVTTYDSLLNLHQVVAANPADLDLVRSKERYMDQANLDSAHVADQVEVLDTQIGNWLKASGAATQGLIIPLG